MAEFVFDGSYDNDEQVAEYLPAFQIVYDEIVASGKYTYNDSFKGRIAGLVADSTNEDTAIYLLQGLRRKRIQQARVADLLQEGYRVIDAVAEATRFKHIVLVPTNRNGGEWSEFECARLVPSPYRDGVKPYAVIPKGKRTNGVLVGGRLVLAA